jgi:hypothetical protein
MFWFSLVMANAVAPTVEISAGAGFVGDRWQ